MSTVLETYTANNTYPRGQREEDNVGFQGNLNELGVPQNTVVQLSYEQNDGNGG